MANYIITFYDGSEAYLAHHGTKGQKWGVRKYQNEDGTYTEEGKERYFGSGEKRHLGRDYSREEQVRGQKQLRTKGQRLDGAAKIIGTHIVDKFSDKKELANYNKRIQNGQSKFSAAMKSIGKTYLKDAGRIAAISAGAAVVSGVFTKVTGVSPFSLRTTTNPGVKITGGLAQYAGGALLGAKAGAAGLAVRKLGRGIRANVDTIQGIHNGNKQIREERRKKNA